MSRGLGTGLKQAEWAVACILYPSSLFHLLLKELISDPSSAEGSLSVFSASFSPSCTLSLPVFKQP